MHFILIRACASISHVFVCGVQIRTIGHTVKECICNAMWLCDMTRVPGDGALGCRDLGGVLAGRQAHRQRVGLSEDREDLGCRRVARRWCAVWHARIDLLLRDVCCVWLSRSAR